MIKAPVGVIGGSGLYGVRDLQPIEEVPVTTPFGEPSDAVLVGRWNGVTVAFLPRHGRGHRIMPSHINARANIFAMKTLGVEWLISVSAVGSMREAIAPGEVVVLVGANGAGKSTLLKTMAGELAVSTGSVRLGDLDIGKTPPAVLARRRGVLPQSSSLSFPFTVHEVVRLGLTGLRGGAVRSKVEAALARVDLAGLEPLLDLADGQRADLLLIDHQVPDRLVAAAAVLAVVIDARVLGVELRRRRLLGARGAADHDDVAALLAADLEDLAFDLVIGNRVLRGTGVADDLHMCLASWEPRARVPLGEKNANPHLRGFASPAG